MRPISELLDFLNQKMTMQTVYQPAVILHLLTRDGFASRADLARMLSGYDDAGLEFWDRVLMDNPKRWLVGKHQILNYDKVGQNFSLAFELKDINSTEKAIRICEQKIQGWIQYQLTSGKFSEDEAIRLNRVLEIARCGSFSPLAEPELLVEEFAMRVVLEQLPRYYPGYRFIQQPYDNPGFDILVGTVDTPIAYVRVKATEHPTPLFSLSEVDRQFSLAYANSYALALVYGINLSEEKYKFLLRQGEIQAATIQLVPVQWKARLLEVAKSSD